MATVLVGALALHLKNNAATFKIDFPYPHDTAFGRIDFPVRWEAILIDRTRALLGDAAANQLFAYPNTSEPYLTTGATNPTPYQYFYAPVSPREHTERVLQILKTGTVPYITCQDFFLNAKDPIAREIFDNYEVVDIPEIDALGELPTLTLYRRKDLPPTERDAAAN